MAGPLHDRSSLLEMTRELIDIPSVSGDEGTLEKHLRASVAIPLVYDDDSVLLFMKPRRGNKPLVIIAGHTDTVPIENNVPSHEDNNLLYGRGASDMKGGLAVMIALSDHLFHETPTDFDVALLFFGREELPADANALVPALAASEVMHSADFAILMEPTSNALEAGCQGNLNLLLTFPGKAGHSARPWTGDNAAHKAILALQALAAAPPEDVDIDGLVYREVASVTGLRSGVARNMLPPSAEVDINVRYSPHRTAADAQELWIRRAEGLGAAVTVISNAAPAPVEVKHPLAQRLLVAGASAPQPKQAWTNASDFAAAGIAAVNFGPGEPALAHTANEHIAIDALEQSYETLLRFAGFKQ